MRVAEDQKYSSKDHVKTLCFFKTSVEPKIMKNTPDKEKQRQAYNQTMEESKKNGIQVKVINDHGFMIRGAIGIGFGTLSRAGYIQRYCSLASFPESISREEWLQLDAEIVLVPWIP